MENNEDICLDLEHKMEVELGDWQSLADNPELAERIPATAKAHLEKERSTVKSEGIVIPILSNQEHLVRDIMTLSDKQLKLLERFVESIK